MKRTTDNIRDPLFRFFEREVNLGSALLTTVRQDLLEIEAVCQGKMKQNNQVRILLSSLVKGAIPKSWTQYSLPSQNLTVHEWMQDFVQRISQLTRLVASENFRLEEVWLGGMFFPEAYITATRQLIAHANGWSLEQLNMHVVSIGDVPAKMASGSGSVFSITGIRVIGAVCKSPDRISITDEVHSETGRIQFTWSCDPNPEQTVLLPVYLYANRSKLLFQLNFLSDAQKTLLYERGIALICNSLLS